MTVRLPIRLRLAGALCVCAVLLAACGSSGKGLIPASNATTLQSDFDKLSSDVQSGNCNASNSDLRQASSDAQGLPLTVDRRLRQRVTQGLADLQQRAPHQCTQSTSSSSSSSTSSSSSSTSSSTPTTTTTSTTTTTTPPSTTSSSSSATSSSATNPANPGGGAQAPPGGAGVPGGNGK